MLSIKWGFAVVVATLITIGVAVPADAVTVKVFPPNNVQCGSTVSGSPANFNVTCDGVAVSGRVEAVQNGTTRQFSVTNFVADNNASPIATKTIRVEMIHDFAGAASTAGLGWSGTFKRGTVVSNVARSSTTSFTGDVKCLATDGVTIISTTPLTTATYTVPGAATSFTANSFSKGTAKTPVPTTCASQRLTGNINVTLQGLTSPTPINDSLSAHSSADLFLGDEAPVKLALVSKFVNVQVHPDITVNPNTNGKVLVALFCKKDFDDNADPEQEKWSLPNPFGTIDVANTTFGGAHVLNNKAGRGDLNGDGCSEAKLQFQVQDTGIQCGDTEATFRTNVTMCIEEGTGVTCTPTAVVKDVTIDTSNPLWCPAP